LEVAATIPSMGRTPTLSVAGMKSRIRRTGGHDAEPRGGVPSQTLHR
jgi:hypothetical protein